MDALKKETAHFRELLANQVFYRYGLVPSSPRFLAFLTHMFLHGGWMHLIFNMLFFVIFGPSLEDRWGRAIFAGAYLISGVAAAVGFMVINGSSSAPMVGASGAIAGMMGAFLVVFTFTLIRMWGIVFLFVFYRVFSFNIPAWAFLPIWIGWEIIQGVNQLGMVGSGDGVAHWAHISGFFFGAAVPFILGYSGLEKKWCPTFDTDSRGNSVRVTDGSKNYLHDRDYKRALRLRENGSWVEAEELFEILIQRYPTLVGPRLELAETLRRDARFDKRKEVLREALEVAAKVEDPNIIEIYKNVLNDNPRARIPPKQMLKVAAAYEKAGDHFETVECLRRLLKYFPDDPLRFRATIQLADVFAGPIEDFPAARTLLNEARLEAKDPVWREEIRQRLRKLERTMARAGSRDRPGQEPGRKLDRTF